MVEVLEPPTKVVAVKQAAVPTLLYGLRPRGFGTADVESLHSLLIRLAYEHGMTANKLVRTILPDDPAVNECLTPTDRGRKIHRALDQRDAGFGWGWDKDNGKNMIGAGPAAGLWAKALSLATGIEKLEHCTLRPLHDHVTHTGLLTDDERVCLQCLKEDVDNRLLPYERLLWRMDDVTCCPKHRTRLWPAKCGRPASEALDHYVRVKHPGVCSTCGSVGYRCMTNSTPTMPALPAELWRAQQCAELVEHIGDMWNQGLFRMKRRLTERFRGENAWTDLATRAGLCKSGLSTWAHGGTQRTSLAQFLDLAAAESVSVWGIICADWTPTPTPEEAKVPQRAKKRYQRVDHQAIRDAMKQAIQAYSNASDVAFRLGVDLSTLKQHEDLYGLVRQGTIDRKEQEEQQRRQAALDEAVTMVKKLMQLELRITLRVATAFSMRPWFPSQLRSQALMVIGRMLRSGREPSSARFGTSMMNAAIAATYEIMEQGGLHE